MKTKQQISPRIVTGLPFALLPLLALAFSNGCVHTNVNKSDSELRGAIEVVQILVFNDADVDKPGEGGWGPIHAASIYGSIEVAGILVDNNADVNAKDAHGNTPLYYAAKQGSIAVVKKLHERTAELGASGPNGETPLHAAVKWCHCNERCNHPDIVKFLIDKGADVEVLDENKNTPLYIAALRGDVDSVKKLTSGKADVNAKGQYGFTPLHCAILSGNVDVFNHLVSKKADVDAVDDFGNTPLHLASGGNMVQIVIQPVSRTKSKAPGPRAVGNLGVVKKLVESGKADLNPANNAGETPLDCAYRNAYTVIIDYLRSKGGERGK